MEHVAVIDDNEAWCFTMAYFLRQQGFGVSTFTDPYRFLPIAEQFDLVLVDFSIPTRNFQREITGSDLINQIKQQLPKPPVLVLASAFFTDDTLEIAQDLCPEADAYLSKSVGVQEIVQQIHSLIPGGKQ